MSGGQATPEPPPIDGSSGPSEELFRLLVDSVTDYAIFALDERGYVTTWNPGAQRLKGYRREEIVGQHFSRFYPREKPRADIDAELTTAVREGRFREEGWRVRKDGSKFWADVTITPLRAEDGAIKGFAKVTRDMTARREAEERTLQLAVAHAARTAAEEAHAQLRVIFEGIAEGILVQGRDGRIIVANDIAARMCGFATAAELTATPISEVIDRFEILDEDGKPFPIEQLPARRALQGEERAEAVIRSRSKGSAAQRWSLTRATPVRDANGGVLYAISIFEDITDRRRLLERLRFLSAAGELLGSSLDYEKTLAGVAQLAVPSIADWCTVDVFDDRSRVRRLAAAHVDPAKVKWAAELNDRYPVDLAAPTGLGAVLRTGKAEIISAVTNEMIQASAVDEDQRRIIRELGLRSYICVPLTARDRIVGALTLLTTDESGRRYDEQDLTLAELLGRRAGLAVENARLYSETQSALTQVTEISRLKDEFLATLSHELRTPLNAIVGWAQMLKAGGMDANRVRKAIETIDRNATLQARLIADILDMSRIITGKVRLTLVPVHPARVIEQALDTIRPAAEAKGITLEPMLDTSAGPITADPERLQQVLWNLLSNAVKFVPKGSRVQVRLQPVNSHVEIVVADNGPGIDADFLPYVFERFRQGDSSSTRSHGGLGLGLAIVKHIVELHGGQVRAENRQGHSGAVFTIQLPRSAALPPDIVVPPGPTSPSRRLPAGTERLLSGIRVMVVDDEDDARDVLGAALEQSGAEVLRCASAAAALEALPTHRPHVLLADIEMPAMDGYALMEAIRALPPSAGGLTPSIAITAYARVEDRVRALGAGFDLHVAKPVQLDELRVAVARLAGHLRQPSDSAP